jgi:hypothetical protein
VNEKEIGEGRKGGVIEKERGVREKEGRDKGIEREGGE